MAPDQRIVHISDLHIEPPPEIQRPGIMERLAADRASIKRIGADLLVVTGDVTNFGSENRSHLTYARDWLEGFGLPMLVVPGNHDLGSNLARSAGNPHTELYEDLPYPETNFGRVIHPSPVVSHDLGTVRVVGVGVREGDPDGSLARLDAVIQADSRPVIVCGHYPLVNPRPGYSAPEFGSDEFVPEAAGELLRLLRAAPNVVAYLCGHVHVNSVQPLTKDCHQITAGGLGPGASTYRVLEVDEEGISFGTILGSGPLVSWDPDKGDHPDEFALGESGERTGRLQLPGGATWPVPVQSASSRPSTDTLPMRETRGDR